MPYKMTNILDNNHASVQDGRTFTVCTEPKVQRLEEKKKQRPNTSVWMSVVKWVATIIMFLLFVVCLVSSKLSIISLGQRIQPASDADKCSAKSLDKCEKETAFIMLLFAVCAPHVIGFVRAARNAACSITAPWPSKWAYFWGLSSAIAETAGLGLFLFILLGTQLDAALSVLFMNGIFVFPVVLQTFTACRKSIEGAQDIEESMQEPGAAPYQEYGTLRHTRITEARRHQLRTLVLLVLSTLFGIGGFALMIWQVRQSIERIVLPVFMVLVSFAWSPKIFKLQSQPKESIVEDREMMEESIGGMEKIRKQNARHRMTFILSLIKLILTPAVALVIAKVYLFNDLSTIAHGFKAFSHLPQGKQMLTMCIMVMISSFIGHMLSRLSCTMNLQKICFAIPLVMATPLTIVIILLPNWCSQLYFMPCYHDAKAFEHWQYVVLGLLMWLSQVCSMNYQIFRSQQFLMAKEDMLFWMPTYDCSLLEQHLLLNRKNDVTDEDYVDYHAVVKNSHIYIVTTMYHEADYEMEQLLQSLAKIDQARKECGRQFESHIFFDDGARGDVVKMYALQLLSLLKDTLGVDVHHAFKLETPYGLQLKWTLPNGMPFVMHLKDKVKVKSKKRWSQVMYMSYILDFKHSKAEDDLTYFLATDADVMFTPNDVMALMDLMSRNPSVGAVCGRTHPLGTGPLVWYQTFDYAIGHWLLKVAEDVFGSVLCSPGCFSVYRARAVRDVLPLYATGVDCAMDFLMKDMGEDRWFCTLLVEAGWRLEYCATAENRTYCPDNFDEFFKQRRRWTPSTLANQVVVINKHATIRENNDVINMFFLLYQAVLMISSIIGPSTVILIIAGGMQYAYPNSFSMIGMLIFLILVTVMYTFVCLYCNQDTQLKVAKILTFFFAIVMAITIVGITLQTRDDVYDYVEPSTVAPPTTPRQYGNFTVPPGNTTLPPPIRNPYIFLPTTWYLFAMIGVFVATALLHGSEAYCLIHGIWYLLCLPSGYLFLTIYSVANLTDRSWGTRETKEASGPSVNDGAFSERLVKYLKYIFWCCVPPNFREKPETKAPPPPPAQLPPSPTELESPQSPQRDLQQAPLEGGNLVEIEQSPADVKEDYEDEHAGDDDDGHDDKVPAGDHKPHLPLPAAPGKSALKKSSPRRTPTPPMRRRSISVEEPSSGARLEPSGDGSKFRYPGQKPVVKFAAQLPRLHSATLTEDWLPEEYQCYVDNFKTHGYDNIAFIAGAVKEKDLINMGISNRGHRKRLVLIIDALPPEELFQEVPENVEEWLINLGLEEYWPKFRENSYTEPRDLADIKYMDKESIRSLFQITKEGHLKRLLMATSVLQYPTKAQTRIREARKAIHSVPTKNLLTDNADSGAEHKFWSELRNICLLPEQAAFNSSGELQEKLSDLRDTSLLVLAVANVLWLTFMVAIMAQGKRLELMGTSFASVAFLFVYTLVLVFQFLSMLIHRVYTLVHFLARAPFKPGSFKSNWSWRDKDLPPPPPPELLEEIRRKRRAQSNSSHNSQEGLNAPLLRRSQSDA